MDGKEDNGSGKPNRIRISDAHEMEKMRVKQRERHGMGKAT